MRFSISFLGIILCLASFGIDKGAIVKGKVFDAFSFESLSGVHIIYGQGQGTISDEQGEFLFHPDTGMLIIRFRFIGYESITRELYVRERDTLDLQIGLKPGIREIEEIVVSPGKTEQKISELTVSTSLIKPAQIVKNQVLNAEELINQTSGIEVMDGQASIRGGSGYSYGAGSRVLVLIDGLPVLAADAGNIKWQFLPLEMISQVEIIKGASSVLYGSSALNGIINFRTSDSYLQPSTKFSMMFGSYGNPRREKWKWWDTPRFFSKASFSHTRKIGNTDLGISGRLLLDQGYRKFNEEKYGGINLKLKHQSKKFTGLKYGFLLSAGYNPKTDFILWEDADQGALIQNEATAMKFKGTFFSLNPYISLEKKNRFRHDLRFRSQLTKNDLPDNPQNNSNAISYFTEYQLWYKLLEKLDVIFGASLNYSKIVSNFHGDHQASNAAGFAQIDLKPTARLKLIAGVRLERNTLDSLVEKLVPVFRSGLNFKAGKYTFLRASFGQGYRYPSIAEKFASTTTGAVIIFPNSEIQSESGWSSEIGLKQGISFMGLMGQSDISLFYTQNEDLIEYVYGIYPIPGTPDFDDGFRAVNIENSRVYGFEWEFALYKNFGLIKTSLQGGYTFMYPIEFNKISGKNTGVHLKYRRKHSFALMTGTSYKNLELGMNFYARSKILNIDDVFLHPLTREMILPGFYDYWIENNVGYLVMDVQLAYNFKKKYTISASVKNILNTEYMGRPGDIMPQRTYSLQLSGNF